MASKSYNSAQLTVPTFAAVNLGSVLRGDVLPGMLDGDIPVMFARIEYSWVSIAGATGGASNCIVGGQVVPTSASGPAIPSSGNASLAGRIGLASAGFATAGGTSVGIAGDAPANSSEYCDFVNMTGGTTGELVPFPKFWCLRLSRTAGTTWTGGTITIDRITLIG